MGCLPGGKNGAAASSKAPRFAHSRSRPRRRAVSSAAVSASRFSASPRSLMSLPTSMSRPPRQSRRVESPAPMATRPPRGSRVHPRRASCNSRANLEARHGEPHSRPCSPTAQRLIASVPTRSSLAVPPAVNRSPRGKADTVSRRVVYHVRCWEAWPGGTRSLSSRRHLAERRDMSRLEHRSADDVRGQPCAAATCSRAEHVFKGERSKTETDESATWSLSPTTPPSLPSGSSRCSGARHGGRVSRSMTRGGGLGDVLLTLAGGDRALRGPRRPRSSDPPP